MHSLRAIYPTLHSVLAATLSQLLQRALFRRFALRSDAPTRVPCERLHGTASFRAHSRSSSMTNTRT